VCESTREEVGEAVPKRAAFSPVFRAFQHPRARGPRLVRGAVPAAVVHDQDFPDMRAKIPYDAADRAGAAIGRDEGGGAERLRRFVRGCQGIACMRMRG
jgi:hypothetical protein